MILRPGRPDHDVIAPDMLGFGLSAHPKIEYSLDLWCTSRDRDQDCEPAPSGAQSGYSSLRKVRGSSGWGLGVRSSRKLKYGATNGSGALTV